MRNICLALYLTLLCAALHAQPYYQRSFGGSSIDETQAILATEDNGIVLGGGTRSFVAGSHTEDVYLTRFDRQGNLRWSKHYTYSEYSFALDLARGDNGSTVVAGYTSNAGFVFVVDSLGEGQWGYTGPLARYTSVCVTPVGDIYALGYTSGSLPDIQLDKFSQNGSLIWSKRFGSSGYDYTGSVAATPDGGAIIAAHMAIGSGGANTEGILVRVGALGGLIWSRRIGRSVTTSDEFFLDVQVLSAGGFLAVGMSGIVQNYQPFMIRTDEMGDTLWTRRFSSGGESIIFRSVEEVAGGFLLGGDRSNSTNNFPFIAKLNSDGDVIWRRELTTWNGPPTRPALHARLNDASLALGGTADDGPAGSKNFALAVMDEEGLGTLCGLETTDLVRIPTTWQMGSGPAAMGNGAVVASTPLAYPAAPALHTLCGDVGIAESMQKGVGMYFDPSTGRATISGLAPGQSCALHNGLGQELCAWRVTSTTLAIDVANMTTGIFLISVRDWSGRPVFTDRGVNCHR